MKTESKFSLTPQELKQLEQSLLFLHVSELKEIAIQFDLRKTGKKITLIHRIVQYVTTGQKIISPEYPSISYGKAEKNRLFAPDKLMLKGQYKNDLTAGSFSKH